MLEASLLFPGQGSQAAGMGRDIADAVSDSMDIWKKAEAVSGLPLREICWDGDEAGMADTRILQPALTAYEISAYAAVSRKVRPLACAGHSLGEYPALVACGALDVESALRLVSLRGQLMSECDPDHGGAMTAIVKLPLAAVEAMVADVKKETGMAILVANYNTPGQYVVSGDREAVDMVGEKAKEAKGRAIPLAVSGAFHSPRMAPAAEELAHLIKKTTWRRPVCPFYSEVTASPLTDGESIRDAMLVQMTSPVRWIEIMEREHADGMTRYLEIGAKPVLSKMVSRILKPAGVPADAYSVDYVKDMEGIEALA